MITIPYSIARKISTVFSTVLRTVPKNGLVIMVLEDAETFGNTSETSINKISPNGDKVFAASIFSSTRSVWGGVGFRNLIWSLRQDGGVGSSFVRSLFFVCHIVSLSSNFLFRYWFR